MSDRERAASRAAGSLLVALTARWSHRDVTRVDGLSEEIGTGEVAAFRASLVAKELGEKRANNILAVLPKPLKYAVDCELIAKAPKLGLHED